MSLKSLPLFRLVCLLVAIQLKASAGFIDAAAFGFDPSNTGIANSEALQAALDEGGTIVVGEPGDYAIARTLLIGSNTTLKFANGVSLKKVNEEGDFTHVILNKGALTKTYDHNIVIEGLTIQVNGMDKRFDKIYGLRGQLALFYVKDVRIERFRCSDLESQQFCIHVCTFEDLIIEDVVIKGKKDGIHLGRGKRFTIRDGVFETVDDAIALNAHDYATSNPELGWIENGVIENCYDLRGDQKIIGFFCRILAGAWKDWEPGMEVQHSDTVVHNGRLYRVQEDSDGTVYKSNIAPTHNTGSMKVDGINWGVVQEDITYAAGVRNVVFRDIFLEKPRVSFSMHFDNDRFSRSYYPGSAIPMQEQILLENVRVLFEEEVAFLNMSTPLDVFTISNSVLRNNWINVRDKADIENYPDAVIRLHNVQFAGDELSLAIKSDVLDWSVEIRK